MPPILYIVFNRPDLTRKSFQLLREIRPSQLYVAADAPRPDREGEAERCDLARSITEDVDWDCDVVRLYADNNMGCGQRISTAITNVLRDHETTIVLEDDCLPEPSFFPYCETLLERYADDERIMSVSGDNFQQGVSRTEDSYYFSKYPHCWGWATWRRAWEHFALRIEDWQDVCDNGILESFCDSPREFEYWSWVCQELAAGRMDSWAMPWTLASWLQSGLTILPDHNLVSNVGFDLSATHTTSATAYAALPTRPVGDLTHPNRVYRHAVADQFTDDLLYSGPWDRARKKKRKRWPFGKRNAA